MHNQDEDTVRKIITDLDLDLYVRTCDRYVDETGALVASIVAALREARAEGAAEERTATAARDARVRAEERERCARIALRCPAPYDGPHDRRHARYVAKTLRALAPQEPADG